MSNKRISQSRTRRRKKKRRLRKRIKYGLIPLLIIIIAVVGYGTYLYTKVDNAINEAYEDDGRGDKSELRDEYVDPKFDNVTILIMGIDHSEKREERYGEVSRTDALILATLNRDQKSVKLLSIPRDSYVYIPEVGYYDKINHAHAFGELNGSSSDGTRATIETVENLLEIPVDYYVKLNFHAFVDVIDAIGGVVVDVPYEFKESNSEDKRDSIHLYEGRQLLNGEEALAMARTRKLDSDVERGKRQLEIIDAVIKKATSVSSLFKYDQIIDVVKKHMSTNMSTDETKSFFYYATDGSKLDVEKLSLAGHDHQPGSVYYWQVDEEELNHTKEKLKSHLELPTYVESDVHDEENEYQSADPDETY